MRLPNLFCLPFVLPCRSNLLLSPCAHAKQSLSPLGQFTKRCLQSMKNVQLCWETRGGFDAVAVVQSGPWSLSQVGVMCGGGICLELQDGADLVADDCTIGGFGRGPMPSASVGVVSWSNRASSGIGCSCNLSRCRFRYTTSNACRFQQGSRATLKECTLQGCGKGIAAHNSSILSNSGMEGSKSSNC